MSAELVGTTGAAARLGITPERVRQLARAGRLPAPVGQLGRQLVWRWDDLAAWAVAAGRLPAPPG